MCLPWCDHVHRSTRESSHVPSHGELWQPCLGCNRATLAASGALLPCLSMSALGSLFERSLTLLSHGRRSWGRVLRAPAYLRPDTCRTRRIFINGDPISGGDCERLPRLPSTAKGQGRLQCNGPGIEVQLSVSKQWNSKTHVRKVQHHVFVQGPLQRHLMDDICSTRNAHALSMRLKHVLLLPG